jgi:hypothetical protein
LVGLSTMTRVWATGWRTFASLSIASTARGETNDAAASPADSP